MLNKLPDWQIFYFRVALIGEVYPQIRAIAVRYDEKKRLLLRYYLDREPTDFDRESIDVVATNLDATTPIQLITKLDVECCYADCLGKDLDPLSGFIYSRREYEIQDNPNPNPNYHLGKRR